jgi:DNA-binding protein HU-beta
VNKAELVDSVAEKTGHTKRDVSSVIEAVIDEIKKSVAKGDKVSIAGLGVFERTERKARTGRNPRTGESVKIPAAKLPKFRAGSEFKSVVNGGR